MSKKAFDKIKEGLDEAAMLSGGNIGEIAHWIAAPMKDVGTIEQFHDVVGRAEAALKFEQQNPRWDGFARMLHRLGYKMTLVDAKQEIDGEDNGRNL